MNGLLRTRLAAGMLMLAACASPITEDQLDARLREAGASVHGLGGQVVTFPINADSQVAAWTLSADSKEGGAQPLARQLSRRMERAAKQGQLLVTGGPYPSLTRRIVLDALALREGKPLAGLVLVYVGSADSAPDVRAAAATLEVQFVRRELP